MACCRWHSMKRRTSEPLSNFCCMFPCNSLGLLLLRVHTCFGHDNATSNEPLLGLQMHATLGKSGNEQDSRDDSPWQWQLQTPG